MFVPVGELQAPKLKAPFMFPLYNGNRGFYVFIEGYANSLCNYANHPVKVYRSLAFSIARAVQFFHNLAFQLQHSRRNPVPLAVTSPGWWQPLMSFLPP